MGIDEKYKPYLVAILFIVGGVFVAAQFLIIQNNIVLEMEKQMEEAYNNIDYQLSQDKYFYAPEPEMLPYLENDMALFQIMLMLFVMSLMWKK